MDTAREKLESAIEKTGLVEVLQSSSVERGLDGVDSVPVQKVALQMRVKPDEMSRWLPFIDFLLQEEEEQDADDEGNVWTLHICKTFMRTDGKLGYVWTMVLSTKGKLRRCTTDVSRAMRIYSTNLGNGSSPKFQEPAQPAVNKAAKIVADRVNGMQPVIHRVGDRVEVDVMPLTGVTEDRNRPRTPTGRGARLIQGG